MRVGQVCSEQFTGVEHLSIEFMCDLQQSLLCGVMWCYVVLCCVVFCVVLNLCLSLL